VVHNESRELLLRQNSLSTGDEQTGLDEYSVREVWLVMDGAGICAVMR